MKTVRATTAQAIVRYLIAQRIEIGGELHPLFPGAFAIFGHGNVTCLGHALEEVKDVFPTWRGQNEQGMALAAVAYAKAVRRRQIMVATSSIGPGATNMVTAAGVAHANRLPVLLLGGDTFAHRIPDPVLQQVESFSDPSVTVNDSFKAVTRFWDRIVRPAQVVHSLPHAVATMLDPASCGPAFIANASPSSLARWSTMPSAKRRLATALGATETASEAQRALANVMRLQANHDDALVWLELAERTFDALGHKA
jgi:3D-(3,5/4)-trihydroxycyclohexane-1,2-dione acylhydrolase (decyclizing)